MENNALSVQLLDNHQEANRHDSLSARIDLGRKAEKMLRSKRVHVTFEGVYSNPVSYGYNFLLDDSAATLKRVRNRRCELEEVFGSKDLRIFQFKNKVLIEVPTDERTFPSLKDMLSFNAMDQSIPLILGEGENGKIFIEDVENVENLLVGGSDKEEVLSFADVFLTTLLYRRSEKNVKVVLIGKAFERFQGIPHLKGHVVSDKDDIVRTLLELRSEMHERIDRSYSASVGSWDRYNKLLGDNAYPDIILLIDKLGRAIDEIGPVVTQFLSDMALKGRYAGIYTIGFVNTSRLIEFPIKLPNIMHRIAFHTNTKEESILLLGQEGAEVLQGEGDMLISGFSSADRRIQMPLMTKAELDRVLTHIKNNSVYGVWESDDEYINL